MRHFDCNLKVHSLFTEFVRVAGLNYTNDNYSDRLKRKSKFSSHNGSLLNNTSKNNIAYFQDTTQHFFPIGAPFCELADGM